MCATFSQRWKKDVKIFSVLACSSWLPGDIVPVSVLNHCELADGKCSLILEFMGLVESVWLLDNPCWRLIRLEGGFDMNSQLMKCFFLTLILEYYDKHVC